MSVNDVIFSFGLEPLDCIPAGTYKMSWYLSPKHGYWLPLVEGVTGHSGIEIHVGNSIADSIGCLLLGLDVINPNYISKSQLAINAYYVHFKASSDNTITYIDFSDDKTG